MNDIFSQEHIFVVFQQGAGGNFLSSLIQNIVKNNLIELPITSIGSAHPVVDLKKVGKDYLSFGTLPDDQLRFKSQEEREEFYLSNIKSQYSNDVERKVVWTHDFSNIPLYKKYFPNSKIFVVTQESVREKIALTCMNVLKTLLAKGSPGPFPEEQWQNIKNRWAFLSTQELQSFLDTNIDQDLKELIIQEYPDIFKYVNIIKRLEYFRLRHYIDNTQVTQDDVVNNSLFNIETVEYIKNPSLQLYSIGNTHQSYIQDYCVTLPYYHVLDSRLDLLENAIEKLLNKSLTDSERDYLHSSFKFYMGKQDKLLLSDPIAYVKQLENLARISREDFKRKVKNEIRTLSLQS